MIARLSVYRQMLARLKKEEVATVSSKSLGKMVGASAAQIRKDLSYFGEFGEPGTGYHVSVLTEALASILGIDRTWNMALVGVGRLGSALLAYPGFRNRGFKVVAAFDRDITKVGKKWEDVIIEDLSRLPSLVREKEIKIAILAVPGEEAQSVAEKIISAGIRAIINFAPTLISVPEHICLRNVDFSGELESLSYFLSHNGNSEPEPLATNALKLQ